MRAYAAQRLALGIPTIIGAALLIFVIMRVVPGDVATLIAIGGSEGEEQISAAAIEQMRERLGLNEPLYMQFATWMWDLAHWDLGRSLWTRQPVDELLVRRYPLTLQLSAMALVLSWIIAIPIGILTAVKQDTPLDYIPRLMSIVGLAIPNFWLGILVMTYLAAFQTLLAKFRADSSLDSVNRRSLPGAVPVVRANLTASVPYLSANSKGSMVFPLVLLILAPLASLIKP